MANDTFGLFGRMGSYDPSSSPWETYEERLEQFLVATGNSEDEARKKAFFSTVIGEHAYTVLRDLVQPDKPADKEHVELLDALKRHFQPRPVVIAERFKLHRRNQKRGESVKEFINALMLSEHGQFRAFREEALRDCLVCKTTK